MTLEELELSVRTYTVLRRAGVDTVERLNELTQEDLMRIRAMGRHCINEIAEKTNRPELAF